MGQAGLICNYANMPRRVSFHLGWSGHHFNSVAQVLSHILGCKPEALPGGGLRFCDGEQEEWTLERHRFNEEDEAAPGVLLTSPLLPLYRLGLMDRITRQLRELPDSRASRQSGLRQPALFHICPEVTSFNTRHLLAHLQAFVLLYDWLQEQAEREAGHAIDMQGLPFSDDYAELVLGEDYRPDLAQLIQHYFMYNRRQGHALDLLPLLHHLDGDRVEALYGHCPDSAPILICRLAPPRLRAAEWSPTREWEKWLAVERLAMNDHLRRQMAAHYRGYSDRLMHIGPNWREDSALWLRSAA